MSQKSLVHDALQNYATAFETESSEEAADAFITLADLKAERNQTAEAVKILRELQRRQAADLGAEHRLTAETRLEIAVFMLHGGWAVEAKQEVDDLVALLGSVRETDDEQLLQAEELRGCICTELSEHAEAGVNQLMALLETRKYQAVPDLGAIIRIHHALAEYYDRVGRLTEAAEHLTEVLAIRVHRGRLSDQRSIAAHQELCAVLIRAGRLDEVKDGAARLVTACKNELPNGSPELLMARHDLARVCRRLGQLNAAEVQLRDILADKLTDSWFGGAAVEAWLDLAEVLLDLGRSDEARSHFGGAAREAQRLIDPGAPINAKVAKLRRALIADNSEHVVNDIGEASWRLPV